MSLLSSIGLKRYIASALTAIAGVLASDPSLAFLLPVVSYIASLFGLTGLIHAGKEGTLLEGNKYLSLSALFSLLVSASATVPQLQKYHSTLLLLAALLGISVVSTTSTPKQTLKVVKKK